MSENRTGQIGIALFFIVLALFPTGPTLAATDISCLSQQSIPVGKITEFLNTISAMPAGEAKGTSALLRAGQSTYSSEGKHAAQLLIAVSLETVGDTAAAKKTFEDLVAQAEDTPYAAAADFRLKMINAEEPDKDEKQDVCETISTEPARDGWFRISGQWSWSTTRDAALHGLIELHHDRLSFRFFQILRSRSPFPPPYAYLAVFIILTVGTRILVLPFLVRTARNTIKLRMLRPQIADIREAYSDDFRTMQKKLMLLYKANGVNTAQGCLMFLLDLVFVIWALVIMSSYSPQMILDGARFLWVADVTVFSGTIVVVWIMASFLVTASNKETNVGQSLGTMFASHVFIGLVIMLIAWYWNWPAYVFIFWILLTVIGTLTTRVVVGICSIISR